MIDVGGGGAEWHWPQAASLCLKKKSLTDNNGTYQLSSCPHPDPCPSLLCMPQEADLYRLQYLRSLAFWFPVELCQLEAQQEIKGWEERVWGISSLFPPCLASCLDSDLSFDSYTPVSGPFHSSSACQLHLLPSGSRVSLTIVDPGCFSIRFGSPAPVHPPINNPFIKLSFKCQPGRLSFQWGWFVEEHKIEGNETRVSGMRSAKRLFTLPCTSVK